MQPSNRIHSRHPCSLVVLVRVPGRREAVPAVARDIGMGGALLSMRTRIDRREIHVELPLEDSTVAIRSVIVRRIEGAGKPGSSWLYGVAFDPHFSERHKLLKIVDKVRTGSRPK